MARIPGYRLHKPSGRAVVTLAGRDYYLGLHGTPESKREYKRLVGEYVASDPSTFGKPKDSITIVELMAGYCAQCLKHYGNRSRNELQRITLALKPVKQAYATTQASEFGPLQFKAVRESVISQRSRGKRRSRLYVNQMMKRIVAMFHWGASEGLLSGNVYEALRLIPGLQRGRTKAVESKPVLPVSTEIVDATLPHLPKIVADMVKIQLLTGCRPAEVCGLKPSMVDRGGDVWAISLSEHKTAYRGKTRTIYAGPKAQAALAPYLLRGADDYCFSPIEAERQRREQMHAERKTPLGYGIRCGAQLPLNRKLNDRADRTSSVKTPTTRKRWLPFWRRYQLSQSLCSRTSCPSNSNLELTK